MYRTYKQFCWGEMTLVIRTQRDPLDLTRAVRAELDQLNMDLPLENIRTMTQLLESSVAQRKLSVRLLSGFAGWHCCSRPSAFTVCWPIPSPNARGRLASARPWAPTAPTVIGLVLQQGMKLAGLGILIGLAGAFVVTHFIRSLLFGVAPTDPLTFAVIPVLLATVALLACWLPARRAANVDPMEALRCE